MSQKAKNIWGQAYAQQAIGFVPWERGHVAEAITIMQTSIELSQAAGLSIPQVLTQADLAAVYGSVGAVEKGLATAQKAVSVAFEQLPTLRAFQCYALTHLADLQVQAGDLAAAAATLQKAREVREEDGRFFTVLILISQSYLALAQGHYQQTITLTQTAVEQAQQFGTRVYTPKLLLWQAQALQASGQTALAYERCQEAKVAAEALGSQRLLWQILHSLSQIEPEPRQTANYQQQAQAIIQFIAEHTPPKLRDNFLNLPQLQAVLTGTNP